MIDLKVINSDNSVNISVNGYLSSKDIKEFVNDYKQKIKSIKNILTTKRISICLFLLLLLTST